MNIIPLGLNLGKYFSD